MPPQPMPNPLAILVVMVLLTGVVAAWLTVLLRFAMGYPLVPLAARRIVPWGAGSVLLTIVAWMGMQVAAGVTYRTLAPAPPPAPEVAGAKDAPAKPPARPALQPAEIMGLTAASNVLAVLAILILLRGTSGARLRDLGVEAAGAGSRFRQGVVAYFLLAPCVFALMLIAVWIWGKTNHPLQDAFTSHPSPATVAVLVFAAVIMAPLSEELVFRGVLLGWLTKVALGGGDRSKPAAPAGWDEVDARFAPLAESLAPPIVVDEVDAESAELLPIVDLPPAAIEPPTPLQASRMILANLAVSIIFAMLHGAQWPAPVPLLVLSMGMGYLYQRTGSILGPLALHMTFNGVSTLLMILMLGSEPTAPAPAPAPAPARKVVPAPVPAPAAFLGSGPVAR